MFRSRRFGPLLVACTCLIGAALPARAQLLEYGPPMPPPASPLGIVIQGGASLGAFEAGVLQYLTGVIRKNPFLATPRVITGTSAGSINGFLAALSLCGHASDVPEKSLFWRTWIPVGLGGLFDPARVTATAVLNREGVMREVAGDLAKAFSEGLADGCDLVFGVPVTRVEARKVRVDAEGHLPVARVGERFALRIRGRGKGRPASVTNFVDPSAPGERVVLATDDKGEVPFANVMALLYASSGIPGAFPAVPIPHCLVGDGRMRTRQTTSGFRTVGFGPVVCNTNDAEITDVVDGGFLDNQPLRLATQLLLRGLEDAGTLRARPDARRLELPPNTTFVALDPASMRWAPDPVIPLTQHDSLSSLLGQLLPGLLEAARTSELQTLIDEHPEVRNRLAVMQSDWPTASGLLGAFMGFVEHDFRVFDFYLGMHEGRRIAESVMTPWATARGLKLVLPDPPATSPEDVLAGWRPVRCMREVVGAGGDPTRARVACAGDELANFRALLQTSIDRLYARCRNLSTDVAALLPLAKATDARRHCVQAYGGAAPPQVPGLEKAPGMKPTRDPDGLSFVLGRLAATGFAWHDLDLGPATADEARLRLAARIQTMTRALAAAQPSSSTLYRSAARLLGHGIIWTPPDHALHALAGNTWELGWSVTDGQGALRDLRFATAVQFDGLSTLVDADVTPWFAVTPLMGVEFEPLGWSSGGFQMRFGLRGGFRFASGDDFTQDPSPDTDLPRSRPVVDASMAGVALQWLRLQLSATWFPAFDGLDHAFTLKAMFGIELDLPL
jgi:predicted acylesterase/phospholipase RssA